jgi:hypothetical protein
VPVTWGEQITGALTVSLRAARPFGLSRAYLIKVPTPISRATRRTLRARAGAGDSRSLSSSCTVSLNRKSARSIIRTRLIPERSAAVAAHSSSQIVRREKSGHLTARLASLDRRGLERAGARRRLFGRRGTLTAES